MKNPILSNTTHKKNEVKIHATSSTWGKVVSNIPAAAGCRCLFSCRTKFFILL